MVIYDPNNDYNRPGTDTTTPVAITVTKGEGVKNVVLSANTIKKGETVTINTIDLEAGYKNAKVEVIGAKYDEATKTISEPTGAVTVKVTATKDESALKVVLDPESAAAKAGVTIAGTHVVTAAENADANGAYKGKGAGTVIVDLKLPNGVTIKAGTVKLTWTENGMSEEKAAESVSDGDTTVDVKPASGTTFNSDVTYTLTGLLAKVEHTIKVKNNVKDMDLTFKANKKTLDEAGGTIDLTIASGLPAYATKVDVYFSITGVTADSTLASTKDATTGFEKLAAVTVTSGATGRMDIANTTNAKADPKASDVVITVEKIVVAEQNAKIEGATGTLKVTTGTAFGLPALTTTVGAQVEASKAIVSISGVTTDDATGFPTSNREMTLTAGKTGDESTSGKHYTSDGSAQVVITVTPVITKLKANSFEVGGSTDTITQDAIVIENGANKAEVTLTVNKASGKWDQNSVVTVRVVSGADGFTMTSEKLAAESETATVTIPVGALKGLTGGKILVIVEGTAATTAP